MCTKKAELRGTVILPLCYPSHLRLKKFILFFFHTYYVMEVLWLSVYRVKITMVRT